MTRTLVVVTRFAARLRKSPPSEVWVRDRFRITRRVTVPPMSRTRAPVVWVWLAADERRDLAEALARKIPTPVIVTADDAITDDRIPGGRFLTARLDSDDAYLPATLDRLAALDVPPESIVDMPTGYQFHLPSRRLGQRTYGFQGPFLALTHEERDTMLDTGGRHAIARGDRQVITHDPPAWVQSVHDANLRNRWRKRELARVDRPDEVLSAAGIR